MRLVDALEKMFQKKNESKDNGWRGRGLDTWDDSFLKKRDVVVFFPFCYRGSETLKKRDMRVERYHTDGRMMMKGMWWEGKYETRNDLLPSNEIPMSYSTRERRRKKHKNQKTTTTVPFRWWELGDHGDGITSIHTYIYRLIDRREQTFLQNIVGLQLIRSVGCVIVQYVCHVLCSSHHSVESGIFSTDPYDYFPPPQTQPEELGVLWQRYQSLSVSLSRTLSLKTREKLAQTILFMTNETKQKEGMSLYPGMQMTDFS